MPFAGQIVVPSYLPSTSTLSNYLYASEGSMLGLVKHPFYETMDEELKDMYQNLILGELNLEFNMLAVHDLYSNTSQ